MRTSQIRIIRCAECFARKLRNKDLASLMKDVCDALEAKLAAGEYSNLLSVVADAPQSLHVRGAIQLVDLDSLDSQDEAQVVQRKRLDLEALCQHYHKHGSTGTFVASVCKKPLENGSVARLCYCFPKYKLSHALEKKSELLAALQLGLSTCTEDVRQAAASPKTGREIVQPCVCSLSVHYTRS